MTEPSIYRSGGGDGDYLSRWKRIVLIDQRLREGDHPSARELADECGVSTKTIQRDLEALRLELSAPIEYVAARRGWRYSDPRFAIPAGALSERELFALMIAHSAVAQYAGTPLADQLESAFDKILTLLPGEVRSGHELAARVIRFAGLPASHIDSGVWAVILAAIRDREEIDLDYRRAGEARARQRRVQPYELLVRDREWFLVAHWPLAGQIPIYYLPRIESARACGTYFEIPPDFDIEQYHRHGFNATHGAGQVEEITLRFEADWSYLATERPWSAEQRVTQHQDGSATLRFRSNALFEVERQVLRYGGAIEVLRPATLRAAVATAAARLGHLHGS